MSSTLTVTPAYGRDYKSKAAVLEAWAAGKDFVIAGFMGQGYINKEDADRSQVGVMVRYDGLRKAILIKPEMNNEST